MAQGNANAQERLDKINVTCSKHFEKQLLFCIKCKELVCVTCITEHHNGHEMQDLNKTCTKRMKQLKDSKKTIQIMLEELQMTQNKEENMKFHRISQHREVIEAILTQKDTLTEVINRYTTELVEQLDKEVELINSSFDEEGRHLKEKKRVLKEKLKDRKKLLKLSFNDLVQLSENKLEFDTDLPKEDYENRYPTAKFIPGKIAKSNIGMLQFGLQFKLMVLKRLTTDLPVIHFISVGNDETLWINDSKNGKLQKVKSGKDSVEVLLGIKLNVFSMVVTREGNLLVATGDSTLKRINASTGQECASIFKVENKIITAVHLNEKNELIIGVRTEGMRYSFESETSLIKINQKGQIVTTFEFDKNNKRLFTYPRYISSNSKGNIGIVDWFSEYGKGHVVILASNGDIINVYDGNADTKTSYIKFNLGGIVCTTSDNFIVTDISNHLLHLLNSNGQLVFQFDTLSIGIQLPYYLTFSRSGKLYVGSLSPNPHSLFEVECQGS
ncbi:unnamed protein product [Mytilus coruscus]|uniref:B box-type domain-containing protein n=1 Tax=Mytilus coruscus TaxID=42192 RepID=A0A6J8DE59_MYTCO|nr:unnamed protein product [Mytilus coruscus]